jgi:hypothetical protein
MASNDHFLALAAHRSFSENDIIANTSLDDGAMESFGKIFSDLLDSVSQMPLSKEEQGFLKVQRYTINTNPV